MKTRYFHDQEVHNLESPQAVVPVILELFDPKSVVDFGCGLGTWLKVFKDFGVHKLSGLDGSWVDKTKFESSVLPNFSAVDLESPIKLNERFDLAISLEVAEHLDKSAEEIFVENLVNSSDIIIFSAAIPNQGGQNHLNEQPLSHWIDLFAKHHYHFYDVIRGKIWDLNNVFWWYKQNMVVFSKYPLDLEQKPPIDIVHPELLRQYAESPYYIRKYLKRSLKK